MKRGRLSVGTTCVKWYFHITSDFAFSASYLWRTTGRQIPRYPNETHIVTFPFLQFPKLDPSKGSDNSKFAVVLSSTVLTIYFMFPS